MQLSTTLVLMDSKVSPDGSGMCNVDTKTSLDIVLMGILGKRRIWWAATLYSKMQKIRMCVCKDISYA